MTADGIRETTPREELARWQAGRLADLLAEIVPANLFWTKKFQQAGVDVSSIRTIDDLRRLPFTNKIELAEDQKLHSPYGTNLTYPVSSYVRLHQTSSLPLYTMP